jgi:histone H3/H4
MSSKTSQRRSKAEAAAAASPAAPAPEPVSAPVAAPAAPAPAPVVSVPEPAAPAAEPSKRGAKRKAPEQESKESPKKASSKKEKAPKVPKEEVTTERAAKVPRTSSKSKKVKAEEEPAAPSAPAPASAAAAPTTTTTSAEPEEDNKDNTSSDGNPSINRYLRTLLKLKYPDSTISKEAIQEVQHLVYDFGLLFLVTVKRHLESAKKNTLMMPDMPICLQRVLSASGLYAEFAADMEAALTRYYASYPEEDKAAAKDVASVVTSVDEKRKKMWAARAGLSIPPTRIKEFSKQYLPNYRFSQNSITGLTALMERLATLVFRLSFEKAQELNRKRISQADVRLAVAGYNELVWLITAPLPVLPIV